jgi:outer membrane protein assembly factor BamB
MALDVATGSIQWQKDLLGEFGGSNIQWGLSESPLVDGDHLIVTPGGRNASMVALNKMTGEEIWSEGSDRAGYSSPVVAQVNGIRQYITLTASAAVGHRADTGEQLWSYPRVANRTANIATPLVSDDHVFLSTDYGTGGALLRISDSGVAEEVYFSRNMRNHYNTSMLVDGYLYGFSSAIFTAMQFETGEVIWRDRATGKGQVIYADGMLYLYGENGTVALVEPSPEEYREVSRFRINPGNYPTWAVPVIANGRLYLRDQDALYSYDIQAD